ncbi:cell fusion/morphology, Kelch domain-containing protein, putative [Candida dubliniensis CD36]|uniref:Cell fusion/morphology, Kelch domain-containing protein, putative n=1 Tax=Candida dubliniensis (strain CD36 / ATCC MYA-646 / CBS 7987 / NCPF 3949 / NRRL Y-17841) TaxID=573826 RepID=B9W6H4_CANDC|nr:cell fusion/morphology, Kelch domain-containing protein, putative [Candida dubliniensis CD36]CAX44277.1 cell fusion/morphology, Kelch domain-containing protein, putative [Candida dubliniensis CD36]
MARFKLGGKLKKKDHQSDADTTVSSSSSTNSANRKSISRFSNILHHNQKTMPSISTQPTHTSRPPPHANLSVTNPWNRFKLFDSPFPRYRHAAASIASEKNELFLMGGLKDGSVFGDTWKIVPQINHEGDIINYVAENIEVVNNNNPPARVGHAAVLCGNAFIVYGGDTVDTDTNGFPDNNFYLFNINNHKYTIPSHILNKPNGRYGHTIGVISLNNTSSRLYLFGGQLENDVFNDLYYFELNSFKSPKATWQLVEPVNDFKPPPLTNHSMSVYKNKVYVFGGVYNNEKVSNDLWVFDAANDTWTQVTTTGDIPPPVNEHSSCVVDDRMYVYGGNDFQGIIYSSLYVLDLHTLEWSVLQSSAEKNGPGPRCGHSMTLLPRFNKILIMGGDKNDYVDSDPHNFETYESFNGEEVGTMVYELDLNIVDHFLGAPTIIPPVVSYEEELTRPKKAAASARNDVQGYDRHARSFSGGPEDFATPQASARGSPSPERTQGGDDNFVEVDLPSTTISQVDEDAPYDTTSLNQHPLPEQEVANGHVEDEPFRRRSLDPRYDDNSGGVPVPEPVAVAATEPVAEPVPHAEPVAEAAPRQDGKVKQIISELTNELVSLKATTKEQMQKATEKIEQLERQNSLLHQSQQRDAESYTKQIEEKDVLINELKSSLDPSAWDPEQPQTATNISELNRYKLERLELNNKLLYLEQENLKLKDQFAEFEPFMDHQIGELDKFQKVIKVQEEQIDKLTNQVKDQEALHKEIYDWKSKFESLSLEFENYKAIHNDDDLSDGEVELQDDDRSILSSAKSRKDISSQLGNLVSLWNQKHSSSSSRDLSAPPPVIRPESHPVVAKLQSQVDDLLKIGKQNEETFSHEIESLRKELQEKVATLKTVEENYRESIQSVNNTSKALKLNQEELSSQRILMERLVKENNELKLYKKASSKKLGSRDGTPVVNEYQQSEASPGLDELNNEDDDEDVISTAHYNMKIKDLEADLYILKQERDQLKDNVTSLQKQLYLAQNQ